MKDWLQAVFRGQAVLAGGISFLAVYDLVPGFSPGLDLSLRVLGCWSWWLFTVPSLRSIKPLDSREKRALEMKLAELERELSETAEGRLAAKMAEQRAGRVDELVKKAGTRLAPPSPSP